MTQSVKAGGETGALRAIHNALSVAGVVLFRNNVGVARFGTHVVRYGLGTGSADLVGLYRGRFVAVEVKSAIGRQSPAQRTWQETVERAGGLYVLARDVKTALQAVVGAP